MNQQEYIEAKNALESALINVSDLKKQMGDANAWSWFDMLGDSIMNSYFKRKKIKQINEQVGILQNNLNTAVKELKDINLDVDLRISDNQQDELLDVWFDNIFTDARVHGELKELRQNLGMLEEQLIRILCVVKENSEY
ncbi:hypothetical protein [Macrococcoides caseolyticum]|uniref:hypothetical protein n=1 Tax=Macrococcoides caseolyticum TaxID=69966 RepID=UPI001F35222A|nr:hypothetical protein [Macrococcus caseolyticus]MCE4956605.1 hypothetical protein [Macrococcus caseolyticus]